MAITTRTLACLIGCLFASTIIPSNASGDDSNDRSEQNQPPVRIAIWQLKPLALDTATADKLELLLRVETSRLEGYRLQDKKDTEATLLQPQNAWLRDCGGETHCLCAIGKTLQVNKLVTGVIGALGDDYTFDLKLVDISGCREENRVNDALSGQEGLLIGAIRGSLYKLVVPHLFVGSMKIEVPVEGAEILVDGKTIGQTPLKQPITELRPGSHRLEIQKSGYAAFQEDVWVRFQQTTRVQVDLITSSLTEVTYEKEAATQETARVETLPEEMMEPPDQSTQIMAWTSLGVTVLAVVGATVTGIKSNQAESELASAIKEKKLYAAHQDTIDRGESLAQWSNIGWGVAAGAAVLTVILFVLDADNTATVIESTGGLEIKSQAGVNGAGLVVECPF